MTTNYKSLVADRMFMTGYSGYSGYRENYKLQDGFSMNSLDAPQWIPGGSTKRSIEGSFIMSSVWISLSYPRVS